MELLCRVVDQGRKGTLSPGGPSIRPFQWPFATTLFRWSTCNYDAFRVKLQSKRTCVQITRRRLCQLKLSTIISCDIITKTWPGATALALIVIIAIKRWQLAIKETRTRWEKESCCWVFANKLDSRSRRRMVRIIYLLQNWRLAEEWPEHLPKNAIRSNLHYIGGAAH